MSYDSFPQKLKDQKQWVLWKKEMVKGKLTKIPYQNTAQKAATTRPEEWQTFEEAKDWLEKFPGQFNGIGYVFTNGIVGIDLDYCFKPDGSLKDWATDTLKRFPGYVEYSQSGAGLHCLIECDVEFTGAKTYMLTPEGEEDGHIERYVTKRFFAVTGKVFGDYKDFKTFPAEEFLNWHNSFEKKGGKKAEKKAEDFDYSFDNLIPEDQKIIETMRRSKNGEKFIALYDNGDWAAYFPPKSQNEADMSLVSSLMFFCRNNTEAVDRIFRTSKLMRDKWERKDYRERLFKECWHLDIMDWGISSKNEKKPEDRESEIRSKLISWKDFINENIPGERWLVENFIPTGLTILAAPPGKYKTFILMQLVKELAEGRDVFGHWKTKKTNVLFINEENPKLVAQDRAKLFGGEAPENVYFTHFAKIKLNDLDTSLLLKICKEKDIKLIIIDSITRVQDIKDSKSSDEVKKNFEKFTPLLTEGISIIYTHHTRKPQGWGQQQMTVDDIRDSTDYIAQSDSVFMISYVPSDRTFLVISNFKRRSSPELDPLKLKIVKDSNSIAFIYSGDFKPEDMQAEKIEAYTEPVIEHIKQHPGIEIKDVYAKFKGKVGEKAVREIIKEAETSGKIISKTKKPKTLFYVEANTPI